jgi:hypothetical protein
MARVRISRPNLRLAAQLQSWFPESVAEGFAMRRLHLTVGLIAVLAFLASGQFMDRVHDHLRGLDDTTRLLFRSTHIYLLFAALLNVALGLYLVAAPRGWRRWLQAVGSMLILVAPVLLAIGFLTEPWLSGLDRPYSRPAIYGSLAGLLGHLVSCWSLPRRSPGRTCEIEASETTPASLDRV